MLKYWITDIMTSQVKKKKEKCTKIHYFRNASVMIPLRPVSKGL